MKLTERPYSSELSSMKLAGSQVRGAPSPMTADTLAVIGEEELSGRAHDKLGGAVRRVHGFMKGA